jgi:DNA-binding transcriptional MerR regulator
MAEEGFNSKRVSEIVGISYRQLDYWARTDLVRPSLSDANGSGSRRRYSYRDVVALKVIKKLQDAGIKLEAIRDVFAYLREKLGEDAASANLVIDGSTVLVLTSEDEFVDAVRQGQGVLNVLSLAGVTQEVDERVRSLRPAGEEPVTAGRATEAATGG